MEFLSYFSNVLDPLKEQKGVFAANVEQVYFLKYLDNFFSGVSRA